MFISRVFSFFGLEGIIEIELYFSGVDWNQEMENYRAIFAGILNVLSRP